jgi:hypothetical protein
LTATRVETATLQFGGTVHKESAKRDYDGGWGSGGYTGSDGGGWSSGAAAGSDEPKAKKRKHETVATLGLTRFAVQSGMHCAAMREHFFEELAKGYGSEAAAEAEHLKKLRVLQLETLAMRQTAQAAQQESMPAEDFAGSLSWEMEQASCRRKTNLAALREALSCWPLPLDWKNVKVLPDESD